jgi:hypothetical protein
MAINRTPFNALVDDSGAGVNGSTWDKNKIQTVLLDPIDALIPNPLSWTPTLVSSGGGTPTYTVQVGRYQLTNGQIQYVANIVISAFNTLAAGNISLGGLPTASVNVSNVQGYGLVPWFANMTTSITDLKGLIQPNTSLIDLWHLGAAAVNPTRTTRGDISATLNIIMAGSYFVA